MPVKGMRAFSSQERRKIRARLIEKFGLTCQLCFTSIDLNEIGSRNPKAFSIDHIIALADGGENRFENFHPTHAGCNNRKGSNYDKTVTAHKHYNSSVLAYSVG
jgi:5-methylcytosine-specific restriction endonuclease McrA